MKPTLNIPRRCITLPILFCTILWLSLSALDVWKLQHFLIAAKHEYILLFVIIAPRIYSVFAPLEACGQLYAYAVLGIGIPYILPTLVCVVSAALQINSLIRLNVRSNSSKRITMTIVMLTACFFLCNIPYFLYFTVSFAQWTKQEFLSSPHTVSSYFVAHFPGTINSILNPVILICRGRSLTKFSYRILPCVTGTSNAIPLSTSKNTKNNVISNTWVADKNKDGKKDGKRDTNREMISSEM